MNKSNKLKSYVVGGYVRDLLMGIPPKDRDWIVVGATPEEMVTQKFVQVGADFPVFIHPDSKEEYALARTERKSGKGYHGFSVDFSPEITLEEDLKRRDLTINAMAQDPVTQEIIDPYNGQGDLKNKCLRHVSTAFREDPIRVLRIARFYARFFGQGFSIAPETKDLLIGMVTNGELLHLTAERVWLEIHRALTEPHPDKFFELLRDVGALKILIPELDALFGVPQKPKYHGEIDCFVHTMMALRQAVSLKADPLTRFAVLCHDFGKGVTAKKALPAHIGHEAAGVPLVRDFCHRYRVPTKYKQLALVVTEEHLNFHRLTQLRAATVVKLIARVSKFKDRENLERVLLACKADALGRISETIKDYPQLEYGLKIFDLAAHISADPFVEMGIAGPAIGEALLQKRIEIVSAYIKNLPVEGN